MFVRVFRALPRFKYDRSRGRFGGWVGKITRNEIIRFLHEKQRAGRFDGNPELTEFFKGPAEGEWIDEFNESLIRLAFERVREEVSAENWELFEASWKTQQKPGEVARARGVSPSRVHKARFIVSEKLKKAISKISDDIPLPGPPLGDLDDE